MKEQYLLNGKLGSKIKVVFAVEYESLSQVACQTKLCVEHDLADVFQIVTYTLLTSTMDRHCSPSQILHCLDLQCTLPY